MTNTLILTVATSALLLMHTKAEIFLYAEYHLGEEGSLGEFYEPLDSVGNRDLLEKIRPEGVSIGTPSEVPGSTAYLDTSDPTDSGYYHLDNFTDLPSDNVAMGVYAKAASMDPENQGTIFCTGEGGFDIGLRANGWAGSIFNVGWIGEPGGVTGSFTPDVWTHLALVRADGVATFYINGVAQEGTYEVEPVNALPHVSVAPGGFANGYFDGGIDEIRVVTFDPAEPIADILAALEPELQPSSPGFRIIDLSVDGTTGETSLTFPSQAGQTFKIETSPDLESWTMIEASFTAAPTGTETTYVSSQEASKLFLRVTRN